MSTMAGNSLKSLVVLALISFLGCGKKNPTSEELTRPPTTAASPSTKLPAQEVRSEITGLAWCRRESDSGMEIFQGMDVVLIKDKIDIKDCRATIKAIKGEFDALFSLLANESSVKLYIGKQEKLAYLKERTIDFSEDVANLLKLTDGSDVAVIEIYSAIRTLDSLYDNDKALSLAPALFESMRSARLRSLLKVGFYELAASQAVKTTKSGIDGKYKLSDIPSGSYRLYGRESSDRHIVEWMASITIASNLHIKLDLSTDTAAIVFNK